MEKLYSNKDKEGELYFQISTSGEIFDFLNKVAVMLFDDSFMIEDHYIGEIKENDQFSYSQDELHLVIVMSNGRAHVSILGLPDKLMEEIKDIMFENYAY